MLIPQLLPYASCATAPPNGEPCVDTVVIHGEIPWWVSLVVVAALIVVATVVVLLATRRRR